MQGTNRSRGSVQSGHNSTVTKNVYKDNRSLAVQLLIVSMLIAIIVMGNFIVFEMRHYRAEFNDIERTIIYKCFEENRCSHLL